MTINNRRAIHVMRNDEISTSYRPPKHVLTPQEVIVLSRTAREGRESAAALVDPELELTSDEREALTARVEAGIQAKQALLVGNLRLVLSYVNRYPSQRGIAKDDLVNEGNIGLQHSIDLFDERKGFKFSTYAMFWIRQAVQRAVGRSSIVFVPSDTVLRVQSMDRLGATDAEHREVAAAVRAIRSLSFDAPTVAGDSSSPALSDVVASTTPDSSPDIDMIHSVGAAISEIPDAITRFCVVKRFGIGTGEPQTLKQIAEELSVREGFRFTTSRVGDHLKAGLGYLRDSEDVLGLRELLAS